MIRYFSLICDCRIFFSCEKKKTTTCESALKPLKLAFFERSKLPDFFSCILQVLGHLYKKKTKHNLRY